MHSPPEHNSKQASQALPSIETIKNSDPDELLGWIQKCRPKLFKADTLQKFKTLEISGDLFVDLAGNMEFFQNTCKLPIGPSKELANLAGEIAGWETAGMVQKRKEQDSSTVESAEPSSKRRRLEELDAILISLAEKARGQRNRLQEEYPNREELCERLSNPAIITKLPFPFPGKGKPTERFTILNGESWSYVGREYFTTLLNEVTQLTNSATRKLSLYGTIGYGKSHLLAALVCYLTVDGKRVVYIPDSRECCEGPFKYFQAAMLFAWADNREVQENIMELKSMEDINHFFGRQPNILFIVDQINALDFEDGDDTVSNDMKKDVRKWINDFAMNHDIIYSASANYRARAQMETKQTNQRKIYVYGGFSATEMQQWWIRNEDALPDKYKPGGLNEDKPDDLNEDKPDGLNEDKPDDLDEDKSDDLDEDKPDDLKTFMSKVEDITGCIPLLLDKCIVEGKIDLSAPKLNQVFIQVQQFIFTILKKHETFWEMHCEYVTACIINEVPPAELAPQYIDHRYFYVEDGMARYACGIAREAAARQLRQYKMTAFANQKSLDALVKYIHNPSVTGFFIEQAVLSSIVTRGLAVKQVHPHVRQEMFRTPYPKFDQSLEGWVLYCPLRFNYPAIDAILVRFVNSPKEDNSRNTSDGNDNSGEKKKCLMYPIQVTVAKSHADSAKEFFNHQADWAQDLDDYDIEIEFCWITLGQKLKFEHIPASSRSLKSRNILRPSYKMTHIPLREVSQEIWSKYRRAKESQGRGY